MKPILALVLLAASTLPSAAHSGGHSEVTSFSAGLAHYVSSPFHLFVGLAVIVGAFGAWMVFRKRRETQSD